MLSQGLAGFPQVFSPVFVSLIRAGEQTGRLVEVFENLGKALKWHDELVSQTRKLLMYPAFVLVVVMAVVVFLLTYLVPQVVTLLKTMGLALPLQTRILIALSNFVVHFWYIVLLLPVVVVVGTVLTLRRPTPRRATTSTTSSCACRSPVRSCRRSSWRASPASSRSCTNRASPSSMPSRPARTSSATALSPTACSGPAQQISSGESLSEAFRNLGLFPPLVLRMMRVGENTGALDTALLNINYFYERDVRESIDKALKLLEPTMTLVLGGILALILFSVLTPIYDMSGPDEVLTGPDQDPASQRPMAKKLLLCASTFHISAALWSGRRLLGCRGFEDDEAGHAGLPEPVAFHRRRAGVPDGRHGRRGLPFRDPAARRGQRPARHAGAQAEATLPQHALLRRQLQQREGDKRRDDRYLFAALTNPEIFSPWLQFLLAAKAPIAGVFPLPMVSLALIERLGLQDAQRAAGVQAQRRRAPDLPEGAPLPHQPPHASAGGRSLGPGRLRRGDPQHAHVPGRAQRHARRGCRHRRDRRQRRIAAKPGRADRAGSPEPALGARRPAGVDRQGRGRPCLDGGERRRPAPASAGAAHARNQPRAAHAHERLQPLSGQPLDLSGRCRRRAGGPDLVGREPVPGAGPEGAATRDPCGDLGAADPVSTADPQLSAFPSAPWPPEANGRGGQADRGQRAPAGPGLRRGQPGPGHESRDRSDRSDLAARPSGWSRKARRASWRSRRSCSCS